MCAWLHVLRQTILAAGALGIGICSFTAARRQMEPSTTLKGNLQWPVFHSKITSLRAPRAPRHSANSCREAYPKPRVAITTLLNLHTQQPQEVGIFMVPILQMRNIKPRKDEQYPSLHIWRVSLCTHVTYEFRTMVFIVCTVPHPVKEGGDRRRWMFNPMLDFKWWQSRGALATSDAINHPDWSSKGTWFVPGLCPVCIYSVISWPIRS